MKRHAARTPGGGACVALGAALAACSNSELHLALDPPAGAASWGAIAVTNGLVVGSSELQPAGEALELSAPDDAQVLVLAWSADGVRGPVPSVPAGEPLTLPGPQELPLPAPIAAWSYADPGFEVVPIREAPSLTRASQSAGCDALDGQPAHVDSHCAEFRCVPEGRWHGCIARLTPGVCTFERDVSLAVSPEGAALPLGPEAICAPLVSAATAGTAAFDCSRLTPDCVFEVPSPLGRAGFAVERVKVSNPEFDPLWSTPRWPSEPWGVGSPHEITVQRDRVFLAEVEGVGRRDNFGCAPNGTAKLSRRSLDALATVTASRSVSGCLDSLSAFGEDRLLVLHTDQAGLQLVEFDSDLRELRRVLLLEDLSDGTRTPVAITSFDQSQALIFLQRGMAPDQATQVFATRWFVDLERFEVTDERTDSGRWDIDGGEALPNGLIALASSARDGLYFVEPDLDLRFGAEKISLAALWVFDPVWDPIEQLLFVPMIGTGSIFALRGDQFEPRAAHALELSTSDVTMEPLVVLPNAFAPGRGLVALGSVEGEGSSQRHRASIAPFESAGPRIGLGRRDVGEGSISKLVSDGRGAAIAVMPWTGELLRITPMQ